MVRKGVTQVKTLKEDGNEESFAVGDEGSGNWKLPLEMKEFHGWGRRPAEYQRHPNETYAELQGATTKLM
jgi:hypothetical protein